MPIMGVYFTVDPVCLLIPRSREVQHVRDLTNQGVRLVKRFPERESVDTFLLKKDPRGRPCTGISRN